MRTTTRTTMTRYKPQTIAEKGGLKPHMKSLGVDYDLFKLLRALPGQNPTTIARSLSKGRPKQIRSSTVVSWFRIDDKEVEEQARYESN